MTAVSRLTVAGAFVLSILAVTTAAHAADSASPAGQGNATANTAASSSAEAMTDGEIKKVDKGAGKLTIKHGELKNLGMPAMTMVFKVKDPSMLESVKTGDKVSFVAEKVGSQFTVTQLESKK